MNMVRLNCQFDKLPLMFMDKIMNNLFKPLFHRSSKKSTPIFRTKDQMIDK